MHGRLAGTGPNEFAANAQELEVGRPSEQVVLHVYQEGGQRRLRHSLDDLLVLEKENGQFFVAKLADEAFSLLNLRWVP